MPATSLTGSQQRRPRRHLLARGNEKLGQSISSFSLPHGTDATCPGRTPTCTKLCYVSRYTRRFRLSYDHNLLAAQRADFVARMSAEARMCRVVRVHVSGDFYSEDYTRKWIQIARNTPGTLFYAYTRSWRGGGVKLLEALLELSKLPNFRLNISTDQDTGIPGWLPRAFGGSGNLVYMSVNDQDIPRDLDGAPEHVNIVFRVKRTTVKGKLAGSTVCPVENGIANPVTCEVCRLCFRDKMPEYRPRPQLPAADAPRIHRSPAEYLEHEAQMVNEHELMLRDQRHDWEAELI